MGKKASLGWRNGRIEAAPKAQSDGHWERKYLECLLKVVQCVTRSGLGSVSGALDICLAYSEINPDASSLSSVSKHSKSFLSTILKCLWCREVTDGESECGRR